MKRLFSALRAVCMALFCIMVPLSAFSMSCETFCDGCEVDDREKCKNSLNSFCNCPNGVQSCTVDTDSLGKTCQECVDNNLFGSRVTPSCKCKTVTTCRVLVYYYEAQACSAMSYYTQSKTATDASISLDPPTWAEIGEYGCSLPPTGTYLVGWCTNSEGCTSSEYPAGKTVSCSGSNNNTLHLYPYYAKCPNGTYSNNGNCEDCPAGSYCTGGVKYACGDGKWSSAGATSESGCLNIKAGCYGSSADKECPNTCPAGKYSKAGKASCTDCGGGWYSSSPGASSCSKVNKNCYTTTTVSTHPCPHLCPANSSSPEGSDARADCSCNAGFGGNAGVADGSCSECEAGYFKASAGNEDCSPCGTGKYQGSKGQTKCEDCNGEGEYTTNCAVTDDYKGCRACESCPAGYKCETGLTYECTRYTYSSAGMLDCKNVLTGYYADDCETGGKLCKKQVQCDTGSYCKDGKKFSVDSGKYARGCGEKQKYDCVDGNDGNCNGCTWQEICPSGYYCTGGKKFKVQDGYYATGCTQGGHSGGICVGADCKGCTGETQCLAGSYCANGVKKACPAGTYGSSAGLKTSACSGPCKAGYYCPEGSTSEKQNSCPSGSSSLAGSDAVADCSCKAGFGGDASDGAACSECAAGYFKASAGNEDCSPCGTGKYQGSKGQTKCEDCNGEGEYTTNCAVTDDYKGCEACETCPAGYRCETGLTYECKNYTYSEKGMLDCKNVLTGYYADDCETGGKLCKKQVQCDTGSYCKDSKKFSVDSGKYATGCGINHNSDCVGENAICKGCTGQEICPRGYYCTGGKKIAVLSGRYATQCSGTTVDSSKNCIGNDCQGCQGYETCPAINGKIGYYCTSGQKNVCRAEYYLDKEEGATSCTKCPQGTTFAGSVVVGVENCGLQTCLDYYNEAKEATGVWEEWYDNWSQCSSDGSSLAGCYMAPTKGINGALVDTGAGTNPKCCGTGTFGQCSFESNQKSCIASCTGCRTAANADCSSIQLPDESHTCPGVQTINPPSACSATACFCPHNPYMKYCSNYMSNATNGTKKCYDGGEESGRTDYCKDVCYKECYDIPCTQQCPDFLNNHKDSVDGCSETTSKTYTGRQYTGFECKYYNDSGAQVDAPNCPDFAFTCAANYYYESASNKCTKCLDGYHTPGGKKEPKCTPNVYKVTLDLAEGENGTTEFFYKYNTITGNCAYYTSENVSKCLDVVDGKQTVQKPTRTGYTFAGYYTAANGEGTQYVDKDGIIKKPIYTELGNKTLYAKWTPNVYEVTLNRGDKSNKDGTSNYFYQYETKGRCYYYTSDDLSTCIGGTGGVQIVKPTRTGYTFDGYYTEADGKGTQYVDKDGTTIGSIYKTIGDKTLYAKWTANVFTVNFNRNDGATGDAAPESKTCTYDQACTAATQGETMRKTDHVFKGWNTTNDGTGTSYAAGGDIKNIISEGEITLYAIWKECDACVASTGSKCELKVEGNECKYYTSCDPGYSADGGVGTPAPICKANTYYAVYLCDDDDDTPEKEPATFNDEYTVDAKNNRNCSKPGSLFRGWKGKNKETVIDASYDQETETKFIWAEVGDIEFTAQWKDCPMGYYCGNGIAEQNACPVGSTNGGGAKVITDCYLLGGKSKICSKIGGVKNCFPLPAGVNVTYSGDWVSSAE